MAGKEDCETTQTVLELGFVNLEEEEEKEEQLEDRQDPEGEEARKKRRMSQVTLDQSGIADLIKQVCSQQSEVVRAAVRDEMAPMRKEMGEIRQEVKRVDTKVENMEARISALEKGSPPRSYAGSEVGSSASHARNGDLARAVVIKGFYDYRTKSGAMEDVAVVEYLRKFFAAPEHLEWFEEGASLAGARTFVYQYTIMIYFNTRVTSRSQVYGGLEAVKKFLELNALETTRKVWATLLVDDPVKRERNGRVGKALQVLQDGYEEDSFRPEWVTSSIWVKKDTIIAGQTLVSSCKLVSFDKKTETWNVEQAEVFGKLFGEKLSTDGFAAAAAMGGA